MSREPFQQIDGWLTRLRRSLRRAAAAEAAWVGLLAVVLAGLLASVLVGLIGPSARPWGWGALAAGAILAAVAGWRLWWLERRRHGRDVELAHWVESRIEGLASGVVTAVECRDALRAGGGGGWAISSPALADASARRTAERLGGIQPEQLVDRARLRRLHRIGAAGLASLALIAWGAPELLAQGARQLVSPSAAAGTASRVTVVDRVVGEMRFRLEYPDYVDREPREIASADGSVSALEGTMVHFAAPARHPVREAALQLESRPDARWAVRVEDGEVRGRFRIGGDDRYRLHLTTPDGEVLRPRGWHRVDAVADAEPRARLLAPEQDVTVDPGTERELELLYEASDDHGLGRIDLRIDTRDAPEPDRRVLDEPGGERRVRGRTEVALSELDLDPGDTAQLWFEARDRNQRSGPGVGRSKRRRVEMRDPSEEHTRRLAELDEVMDRMIRVLADRLESPVHEARPSELKEVVSVQQDIVSNMEGVLSELSVLADRLDEDPLATDELRETLSTRLEELRSQQKQERGQLSKASEADDPGRRRELVAVLGTLNDEAIGSLEQTLFALKDRLEANRREQVLAEGRQLMEEQGELENLLKRLQKEGGDSKAAKQAKDQLARLQERLRRMKREMGRMAEKAPYENQNLNNDPGDTEKRMKSARERIDEVRRLVEEGRYEEAMDKLQALQRDSQKMMAGLREQLESGDGRMARVREKMAGMQDELGRAEKKQKQLREQTSELRQERAKDEKAARNDEQFRKKLKEAREEAEAVREQLEEAPDEPLAGRERDELRELRQQAGEMEQSVKEGRLEEARDQAKKVSKQCNGLGGSVGERAERELDPDAAKEKRRASEQLREGGRRSGELAERLERLSEQASPKPDSESRRRMAELEKRQRKLREEMSKLEKKMGEMGQKAPGLKKRVGKPMEEARRSMEQARKRLGQGRPGAAQRHQKSALEGLRQARKGGRKSMQKGQQGRGGRREAGVGPNDPDRRVEIPGQDGQRPPEAFREEILKAMREEDSPERFEKSIERYYEELVR